MLTLRLNDLYPSGPARPAPARVLAFERHWHLPAEGAETELSVPEPPWLPAKAEAAATLAALPGRVEFTAQAPHAAPTFRADDPEAPAKWAAAPAEIPLRMDVDGAWALALTLTRQPLADVLGDGARARNLDTQELPVYRVTAARLALGPDARAALARCRAEVPDLDAIVQDAMLGPAVRAALQRR